MKRTILAIALFISACSKSETPQPTKICGVVTDKQSFANNIDNSIRYLIYWDHGSPLVVTETQFNSYDKGGQICTNGDGSLSK